MYKIAVIPGDGTGPEVMMIRAELSINDPMELEEPRILRQMTIIDLAVWETATIDMFDCIGLGLLRNLAGAILDWKRE